MTTATDLPRGVQFRGHRVPAWALIGFATLLLGWPLVMLLVGAFRSAPPGQSGAWTLSAFPDVFGDGRTYHALLNSVLFSVGSTALALVIGGWFAFVSTRTTTPGRALVTPVMLLMLALPTLLYAISWSLLGNPEVGLLNKPIEAVFGASPLNVYSWPGMILVQGLKLTSFCYFLLLGPVSTLNSSHEEAAFTSGASRWRTLMSIDLPTLAPTLFGVGILVGVYCMGTFDVPQIIGENAGIDTLSTRIFFYIAASTPAQYAAASGISMIMMLAMVVLILLQWRYTSRRSFATVTGKDYKAKRWSLGRSRHASTASIAVLVVVGLLLPASQVVLTSFQSVLGMYSGLTLANYTAVFDDPQTVGAFQLTLSLSVAAGLGTMVFATLLVYVGTKSSRRLGRYIDVLSLAPLVLPGVVLAAALTWAYLSVPGLRQLYGTTWLCVIGLVILLMPVAGRSAAGALVQISADLEESARASGASAARTFVGIVLPLMTRSFLAGWLVCSVIMAGVLDVPLMLLPATHSNVATLSYSLFYSSAVPTQACALLVLLTALICALGIAYLVLRYTVLAVTAGASRRNPVRTAR
ncbi:iron ABC transporter permease [Actinomadura meridiana]|uniref:Iron ABC transporter permease n=1 Tax=Actinomadura meridiana TaxID=559626 RepID=A0ABP8BT97_9ACTN